MTTGIDYATKFIAMKPDDGSRSTIELLEVERTAGYSDMTDSEITRLIEYKEKKAEDSALLEESIKHNEEMLKQANEAAAKQLEQTETFFNKIINMEPALVRVDGSEVD